MKYLLELKEFEVDKLDHIINRIKSSEYLSLSLRKDLDDLSGIDGFADKLIDKANYIQLFYERKNRDFIDDVLFEFFDEKPYTYKVDIGYYIEETNHYYATDLPDVHRRIYLPDNYESITNKEIFLMLSMLSFIKNLNIKSEQIKDDDIKNQKKPWYKKEFNPRDVKSFNYLKNIEKIFPLFCVDIIHKNRDLYYTNWEEEIFVDGINNKEYCDIQSKISKAIERRVNVSVHLSAPYYHQHFTSSRYIDGVDEDGNDILVNNENPTLIHGGLFIYVNNPMKYRRY